MDVGSELGEYDIDEAVSATAAGLVYRAHHRQEGRRVLVKVLTDTGDRSEDAIAAELFRIATLRHPNILPVEHWGELNGRHYVVTPAEPSRSLEERLRDGRLGRDEAAALLGGIARAVDHAHESGVRHGGLAAASVKLADDGTPMVSDFGLARTSDAAAEAPADVRAFAVIAYRVLTGVEAFEQGDADLGGLAGDAGDRWPSCGAMLEALQPALAVPAAPATSTALVLLPSKVRPRILVQSRAMLAAAGGVAVLAVVLVVVLVLQLRGAEPGATAISLPPPVPGLLSNADESPPPRAAPTGSQRPAAPEPSIRLSAEVLSRGSAVEITGAGFDPHGRFLLTLDQGGIQYQLMGPTAATAAGGFSVRVFVPGQAAPGPATVTACATTTGGRVEGCARQQVSVAP